MNIMEMMKKAQNLQSEMQSMKDDLDRQSFSAESGAGLVKVTLMGDGKVTRVEIDPSLLLKSNREVLQDLVVAAVNNAQTARRVYHAEKMQDMTVGLPIPPGMMGYFE
ncbi:MAG: YbaB/EbfC family nucleoid-associated protein [Alphaproteobacteria bacterium]|nr:YbaB/EbfC family nucleoid-associated protein [Alphaproteobacteria bacterium]